MDVPRFAGTSMLFSTVCAGGGSPSCCLVPRFSVRALGFVEKTATAGLFFSFFSVFGKNSCFFSHFMLYYRQ